MANDTFAQQLAGYNPTVAEEKANNLQQSKENKLNRLVPKQPVTILGNYDADSPRLSDGTTGRLSGDGYYINSPELKNADGTLNPAGINARIQADNFAMGVDAPNFPEGEGLDPKYYQQYKEAVDPALVQRQQEGQYTLTPTGEFGKYDRPILTAQSEGIDQSQTDYLLSKDQGALKPQYVDGKPSEGFKSKRQESLEQLRRDRKGYGSNLVDAVQSSIGKFSAKTGDFIMDLGLRAAKAVNGLPEKEANARLKDSVLGDILGDTIDKDGNFTGLDKYKEDQEYGYDPKRIQGYVKEFKDVWSDEGSNFVDKALVTLKATVHGPEALASSVGDIAAVWAGPIGLSAIVGGQMNEVLEQRAETKGTTDLDMKDYGIAGASAIAYGLINKVTGGNVGFMEIKPAIIEAAKSMDKLAWNSLTGKVLKSAGVVEAKGLGEGLEEIFQEATQVVGEKLLTSKQEDILTKETALELGVAGALGRAGGETASISTKVAKIPEEVGKSAARGAKIRQEKAQVKQGEDAVRTRTESIKEAGLSYGADVSKVESESEVVVDPEGNSVVRFDKPQNIRAESKDATDYETKLEQAKQNVITSTYVLKDGKVVDLNEAELGNMNPDQIQERVNKVSKWMTDYKESFADKDGNVPQVVQDTFTEITSSAELRVGDYLELKREDAVLTKEDKEKASSPVAHEAVKEMLKDDVTPEQYTVLTTMEPKAREEVINTRLKKQFLVEGTDNKYNTGGREVTPQYINRLARETSKSYDISGINFVGVGVEPTFEMMGRVGEKDAAIKGAKTSERAPKPGTKSVDNLTITGDILYNLMEGSLDEKTVEALNIKSTNKFDQRVIKPLNEALGHKVGNRASTMKTVLGKFNKAIAEISDARVAQVFKVGTDPQGSMLKLMISTMNSVNAATASDTEGRQGITSPNNSSTDNSIARDEFYAAQSNVITQAGKDFVSMFGIQLTGNPAQILKQHRELGKLGIELLASQGLVETSNNPVVFKVGDNTVDNNNMKITGTKGAKDGFKWATVYDVSGDKDTVGYEDTGIRLADTKSMTVGNNKAYVGTYESETGDMVKRLTKVLLPVSSYVPTAEPETGAIKTDPEVVLYKNEDPEKDIATTIQDYRERKFNIASKFKERLKVIRDLRDNKYDGSLVQAARKESWISELLGLEKSDSLILQDSDSGSNGGKLDSINGILDNLDDLDGDFYFDYQVDLNNRITVLNNVLNYQHDNVFSRHVVVGEEYTVDEGTKQEELLLNGVLEDMGMKFDTKEEWTEARSMLKNPSTATGKIKNFQTIAKAFASESRSETAKLRMAMNHMKGQGYSKGAFKFMKILDGISDIASSNGSISTNYMVEMDARASGVTNTTLNISGRDTEQFKSILKTIGIKLDGVDYDALDIEDAYQKLQNKVVEELNMDVLEAVDGSELASGGVDGVSSMIKALGVLGIDTRDLAKGPVMTWFYSAGEATITKDLTDNLIKQVVSMAANGDQKALDHLKVVLNNEDITPTYVKNMSVLGKDAKALRGAYNSIGELYFTHLDGAFPEVENYKKEMNDIFAQLVKYSKVGGIDFFQGVVRSASQALYDNGKPMEYVGLNKDGSIKRPNGSTSIYKSKDVVLADAQKKTAGLDKGGVDSSILSTTVKMENQASIMALLAQSSDFAIIEPAIQSMMSTTPSGFLSVHDALYGSPEQLLQAKEVYEQTTLDVAVNNDFVETLIQSAELAAKGMNVAINDGFFKGDELSTAKSYMKKLNDLVTSSRLVNTPRVEAKTELLEGAESHVFGEQDADMVQGTKVATKKKVVKKETKPKPVIKEEPKEKTIMEKFIESKDVSVLLSDIANENDLLKGKVERVQADNVPIIVFDEAAKKELFKEIDSIPESELSTAGKVTAKQELNKRLEEGSSFSAAGRAYIGRTTAEGTNELNKKDGTVESVLDTIAHEVEHGVTNEYVEAQDKLGKNASKEYRVLTKAIEKLKKTDSLVRTIDLNTAAGQRLNYIIDQPTIKGSIKELLSVYQAEDSVVDEVLTLMAEVLDVKPTFLQKVIQGIRKAVSGIIDGMKADDIAKRVVDGSIEVENIIFAAEAVSMRARESRNEKPTKKDIDNLSIDGLFKDFMKDCKI